MFPLTSQKFLEKALRRLPRKSQGLVISANSKCSFHPIIISLVVFKPTPIVRLAPEAVYGRLFSSNMLQTAGKSEGAELENCLCNIPVTCPWLYMKNCVIVYYVAIMWSSGLA